MLSALLAQDPTPARTGIDPMFLIAGLFLLFWLVVLMPMSRRQKKDEEKVRAALKRGTKVLTSSGIVGTVLAAKDGEDEIVIRSEDSKLRIKRNTVQLILGTDDTEAGK